MRLVDELGREIQVGDRLQDFRGEWAIVTGWQRPLHSASTGRVYTKLARMPKGQPSNAYFPSVYGLVWAEEKKS